MAVFGLYDAVNEGNIEKIRDYLLYEDHDVNEPDGNGYTALYKAAKADRVNVFALLLMLKANPEYKIKRGSIRIQDKIQDKYLKLVSGQKFLSEIWAKVVGLPVERIEDKLDVLVASVLEISLERQSESIDVAFLLAEAQHSLKSIEIFDSLKSTQEDWLMTACATAFEGNMWQTAEILLPRFLEMNQKLLSRMGEQALTAKEGQLFSILLNANFEISPKYDKMKYSLHLAAERDDIETFEGLPIGTDIENKDDYGQTLLHVAVGFESENTFRFLVRREADIHALDNLGRTPLHYAASKESDEIILGLIKEGSEVNKVDSLGNTPLHYAAFKGTKGAVKILLESGANNSVLNLKGFTPLLWAIRGRDRSEQIDLLVKNASQDDLNAGLAFARKNYNKLRESYFLKLGAEPKIKPKIVRD
jgi:ankyrin repeat protein